jgi:hypothetical protein
MIGRADRRQRTTYIGYAQLTDWPDPFRDELPIIE